jgi:hypothetical protein
MESFSKGDIVTLEQREHMENVAGGEGYVNRRN